VCHRGILNLEGVLEIVGLAVDRHLPKRREGKISCGRGPGLNPDGVSPPRVRESTQTLGEGKRTSSEGYLFGINEVLGDARGQKRVFRNECLPNFISAGKAPVHGAARQGPAIEGEPSDGASFTISISG